MTLSWISKNTPGGNSWTYCYLCGKKIDAAHDCCGDIAQGLERSLRGLSHVFYHTDIPILTGAIKSWLSCQLKGSEVKLILSETGWQWAAWRGGVRGPWPVDCYDGLGRTAVEVRERTKTSGDKRWIRVTGQICRHLMLFSETRLEKAEGGERCPTGAVLLRAFYRNDSALSENTSVEVKNNLKKKKNKKKTSHPGESQILRNTTETQRTTSRSFGSVNVSHLCQQKSRGRGPTGLRPRPAVSDNSSFVYTSEWETERLTAPSNKRLFPI